MNIFSIIYNITITIIFSYIVLNLPNIYNAGFGCLIIHPFHLEFHFCTLKYLQLVACW